MTRMTPGERLSRTHPINSSWKNMRTISGACITCKHFVLEDNLGMMQCGVIGICKLFCDDPASGVLSKYSVAPPCAIWSYEKR